MSVDGREKERHLAEESGAVTEEHVDATDRKLSESSLCRAEEDAEDEEEEGKAPEAMDLGPRISIKDQLEKDKVLEFPFLLLQLFLDAIVQLFFLSFRLLLN